MSYLDKININETYKADMLNRNSDILDMTDEEIDEMIEILVSVGCNERSIENIITANPNYLSRSKSDIRILIKKLNSVGITNLETTFNADPWLLNCDAYEIDEFIQDRKKEGLSLDDIIDLIDSGKMMFY